MRLLSVLVAIVFAAISACGPCDDILAPYCPAGRSCWIDIESKVPNKAAWGECAAGTVVCGADGVAECRGTVTPIGEVCDGLDNDCDGEIDERAVLLEIPDCQDVFCGECRPAVVECLGGEPTCVSVKSPEPEVCDGRDNDCDCSVDNDLSPEFFYGGPDFTVGRGQCVPGVRYCQGGTIVEVPAVYPEPELCDGIDNDCDGFVDESDTGPTAYYLILDVSGSMSQYREAAAQAFCNFARTAPTSTRFALAVVAGDTFAPYTRLAQDFADAQTTCDTINTAGFTDPHTGAEYMLEPWTYPSWPGSDTVLIAVTDETLRVFNPEGVDPVDAVAICVSEGFSTFVYTHTAFDGEWRPITDVCGGDVRSLPESESAFRAEFVAAFISQCGVE